MRDSGINGLGYFGDERDEVAVDDRPARPSEQVDQENARRRRYRGPRSLLVPARRDV